MDFSSVAQIGAKALVVGPTAPEPQPMRVQRVAPKPEASGAGNQSSAYSRQNDQADAGRDILALRQAVAQGRRSAGPPPSFEVSLLEVESDLQQKLARMESARAMDRDAEALQATRVADTGQPAESVQDPEGTRTAALTSTPPSSRADTAPDQA